jgi:poly(3-hydroxyalkanoate) synthetase
METANRISTESLLDLIGYSPADNSEGYTTAIPWKSRIVGTQVRIALLYKGVLKTICENPQHFGPFSYLAGMQKAVLENLFTDHIRRHSRISTRNGVTPDIFVEQNDQIEEQYAGLLFDLTGLFIKSGKFNHEEAVKVSSSPDGQILLKKYICEFAYLEQRYNSWGLTRLKALKELMTSLLISITEQPAIKHEMPFMKKNKDGSPAMSLQDYIESCRNRLENIYNADAFDIKSFSERATGGRIGYSRYEVVPGSQFHDVTLRHYLMPEGVKSNGKILYLSSPLINMPEIYDLAQGKSVIEVLLMEGYEVYLVDNGNPGPNEVKLGLGFYGKTVHDNNIRLIKERHPRREIFIMGYCIGGTLALTYLARRAEERRAEGKKMDIKKIALMAAPVKFDDVASGHSPMRGVIRDDYETILMKEMYGDVNIPPQIIEVGMNEIQPGVRYSIARGFFERANYPNAIEDAAPFLYWLTHGTRFPAQAHQEWINNFFLGDQLFKGEYCLPSTIPDLDGKPVNMGILKDSGVRIFDYRGDRDPIAPKGSCIASELWGQVEDKNIAETKGGLNRTIEKNIGHIFVVSKTLLGEYLQSVIKFFRDEI